MAIKLEDHQKAHDHKRADEQRQQIQQQAQQELQKTAGEAKTQSGQAHAKSDPHKVDAIHLDRIKQDEQWKNFSHTKEATQAPSIAQQHQGHAAVEEVQKTTAAQMLRDLTKEVKA